MSYLEKMAVMQTLKSKSERFPNHKVRHQTKHWALLRSMLQTNVENRIDHEAQKLSANKNRVRINLHKIKLFRL